jgi:hypothetical protein
MATQEIPRERWNSFFDRFSNDHEGQTATLEVFGQEIGDELLVEESVFRGISSDLKDRENRIAIEIGPPVDDGTTHSISEPVAVLLKEGADESETSLEIQSADGSSFLLRFVQSTLPV